MAEYGIALAFVRCEPEAQSEGRPRDGLARAALASGSQTTNVNAIPYETDQPAVDRLSPAANAHDSVNAGSLTISPPFRADWWAQMPTHVQLADVTAFGDGSRSSANARRNSLTRC